MKIFEPFFGTYQCPKCNAFLQFKIGISPILDTTKCVGIKCGACGFDITQEIYGKS